MSVSADAAGRSSTTGALSLPWIIAASSVGTLIEWYDFYLYGVLALFFSKHFFSPDLNPTVAFIASLFVFWTGFLVRPFGAILFGHLGDLIGRKFTFMLTLGLMGAATFVVGLLPGYDVIGALAPILLVTMRVLQGLALGGEYGGAATYIAEHSPDGRRGFYTSWIQTTATMGIVLALLVILICRLSFGDQAFGDWGWRVPFLLSAILVVLSGYIRLKLEESPLFARLKEQGKASTNPAADSFLSGGKNWGLMLVALFGATAPEGVVWYTGQFYALFYLTTVLKVDYVTVYIIMMIALTLGAPFFVAFGALSDRIGRRNIMTLGFALAVITYWPVFTWLGTFKDNPVVLTILVFYMVILVTMVYGPIAAFLVELFPARIRYTSMSLPYHVGNGVFGGLVPAAGASIAAITGIALSGLLLSDGDRRDRRRRQPRLHPRADPQDQNLGRSRRRRAAARPRSALARRQPLVSRPGAEQRAHPFRDRFVKNIVVKCMEKLFPIRPAIEKVQKLFPDGVGLLDLGNATSENCRRRQLTFQLYLHGLAPCHNRSNPPVFRWRSVSLRFTRVTDRNRHPFRPAAHNRHAKTRGTECKWSRRSGSRRVPFRHHLHSAIAQRLGDVAAGDDRPRLRGRPACGRRAIPGGSRAPRGAAARPPG